MVCYLISLNDEAISKNQNGVSHGNSPADTMVTKLILGQVDISNRVCTTVSQPSCPFLISKVADISEYPNPPYNVCDSQCTV